MNTRLGLNRRQFLQTVAVAAAGLSSTVAPAAESAPHPPSKPRIGCLSWCFHDLSPAVDPDIKDTCREYRRIMRKYV